MTQPLWTIEELTEATGGAIRGTPARAMEGVSIDTRTLAEGDIFCAIKGNNQDGHAYAAQAFEKGASLAVVSDPDATMEAAGALLVVPDVLAALEDMGRAARARCSAAIVAITGSVGKTGTKEALKLCLGGQGRTHASVASYNNHWGVPLTLARMPRDTEYGIFEIGMNHAGEITPLTRMVQPHVAVITTVEAVHIEAFDNVEQIADAKAEILLGLVDGGTAILNADNPHYARLKAAADSASVAKVVRFGEADAADARLMSATLRPDGSTVQAQICGEDVTYKIGAPGQHLVMNSLAVLAAVVAVEGDLALAALELARWQAHEGRGAQVDLVLPRGTARLIDESYNANPASMRAALALLGMSTPEPGSHRIAVLGDMLELGEDSDRLHADLADAVEAAGVDVVFACGKSMSALWERLPESRRGLYAETSDGLEHALLETVTAGDVVVVKGSLGSRMGPLVEALKARYPEKSG